MPIATGDSHVQLRLSDDGLSDGLIDVCTYVGVLRVSLILKWIGLHSAESLSIVHTSLE